MRILICADWLHLWFLILRHLRKIDSNTMATNKNAVIRYQALDRCLNNGGRRFYIEDLVQACCDALYEYNGYTKDDGGVKRRQILADLNFMESESGFRAPIERVRDGHKVYYHYSDKNFTINNQPFNQEEIDLMHDALILLKRFDGIPQFECLNELEQRLYSTSRLGDNVDSVVSFQHNKNLIGKEHFRNLFQAIINHRVVKFIYKPFGKLSRKVTVSPYFLKQYNDRWFLIGKRRDYDRLSHFAFDRIESKQVEETSLRYEPCDEDFEDYFSDVVGVSVSDAPAQKVVLKVDDKVFGYIQTKPLHESQVPRPVRLEDGRWEITLKRVQNNFELRSIILSLGDEVEVIEPLELRNEIIESIERMRDKYKEKNE